MRAGRHTASGINGTTTTLRNLSVVESSSKDDIEIALATVPTTTTVSTTNENMTYPPIYDEASEMLRGKPIISKKIANEYNSKNSFAYILFGI
jgi:hypothetical protein